MRRTLVLYVDVRQRLGRGAASVLLWVLTITAPLGGWIGNVGRSVRRPSSCGPPPTPRHHALQRGYKSMLRLLCEFSSALRSWFHWRRSALTCLAAPWGSHFMLIGRLCVFEVGVVPRSPLVGPQRSRSLCALPSGGCAANVGRSVRRSASCRATPTLHFLDLGVWGTWFLDTGGVLLLMVAGCPTSSRSAESP